VRIRWQSSDATVVGFNVYTRAVGATYGAPIDVGAPTPAADGTQSATIGGRTSCVSYAFIVAGRHADGSETPLSNEIVLAYATAAGALDSDGDGLRDATEDANLNCRVDAGETDPYARDTDGDGVGDAIDACLATPSGELADASGCSCSQVACGDGNSCTTDACVPGTGCTHTAVAGCTTCTTDTDCADADACTEDACDTATQRCVHLVMADCCTSDAQCTDVDACTTNERCVAGQCVSDPVTCATTTACQTATCDAQVGCVVAPASDGTACAMGDVCSPAGTCTEGTCVVATSTAALAADVAPEELRVQRLVMRHGASGRTVLLASGVLPGVRAFDVGDGVVVQVDGADGSTLFRKIVEPDAFAHTGAALALRSPDGGTTGLRRLSLQPGRAGTRVAVTAVLPAGMLPSTTRPARAAALRRKTTVAASSTKLRLTIKTRKRCATAADVACDPATSSRTRCR
jgi:hypothetical protein